MTLSVLRLDDSPSPELKLARLGSESPETRQLLWNILERLAPLTPPLVSLSPDRKTIIGEERGDKTERSLIMMQKKEGIISNSLNCESVLRTVAEEHGVHIAGEFALGQTTIHMTNHFARASATAPTTELALANALYQLMRSGIQPANVNRIEALRPKGGENWELLKAITKAYPDNFHIQNENEIERTYFFSEDGSWTVAAHREHDKATATSTTGILKALREMLLHSGTLSYALVAAHPSPHLWIHHGKQQSSAQGKSIWHPLAHLLLQGET